MHINTYLDELIRLPSSPQHPLELPPALAAHLSPVERTATPPRLPLSWVEYRPLAGLALSGLWQKATMRVGGAVDQIQSNPWLRVEFAPLRDD